MKRLLLLVILTFSITSICLGIPAKRGWFEVKDRDGKMVEVEMVGDEYWHGVVTRDGMIMKEVDSGVYELTGENIAEIDIKAMRAQSELRQRESEIRRMLPGSDRKKPMGICNRNFPSKVLVILVGFSDKAFTKTNASFNRMMNDMSGSANNSNGSAKQYFLTSSYGQYNPTFDVYGPYTLDHECKYYGGNRSGSGSDQRAAQMIVDAAAKLAADKGNGIFQQYDCNNDGYVDNVFVFYAGYGENAGGGSNCIWPHQSYVYSGWVSGTTTYGNVTLGNYACASELRGNSGSSQCGVGPFCHEFSHVIGLPDMYDTGYSGHRTCSLWDVMDAGNYLNNEKTPPSYSSYERFYVGWLTPTVLSNPDNVTMLNLNNGGDQAYLISETERHNLDGENPNPEEFFMLEHRQLTGWDSYLPGPGMLITKVRYDESKWAYNSVNNDGSDMGVDIIEAGGVTGYIAQASDAFPGTGNVTSYTPYSGQPLTDITEDLGKIKFKYKGGRLWFKVGFDAMDRAICSTKELWESEVGAGVVLPTVDSVADGYKFEGWSESASAAEVSAGFPGDTYYPAEDMKLFAVYSKGGVIEPTESGCVTETFNKLTKKNVEITDKMDKYADLEGWYGVEVYCDNGAARCGSNSRKGKLLSPNTKLSGDMTITVRAKALGDTKMAVSAGMSADTVQIGKNYGEYEFHLKNVQMDSRIWIECEANVFYIDSIEFCGAKKSPVESVKADEVIVVREGNRRIVYGVEVGDMIRIVDMSGKVLIYEEVTDSSFVFNGGSALYVIEVRRKGSTFAAVLN